MPHRSHLQQLPTHQLPQVISFLQLSSLLWLACGLLTGAFSIVATSDSATAGANAVRTLLGCSCLYAAGAVVAALALGACGGGGGDPAFCAQGERALAAALEIDRLEGLVGLGLLLVVWRRAYADFLRW